MSTDPTHDASSLARELMAPIGLFVAVIVIALAVLMFGPSDNDKGSTRAQNGKVLPAATMRAFRNKYDAAGVPLGPADAGVTIREFADYQCPACGAFEPTAEKLRQQYVETGKLRFVFFDFPLPMHRNARAAAVAARCAGRQKTFWAYHDKLYANQDQWAAASNPTGNFLDLAVESGVDLAPFKQCLRQDAAGPAVEKSMQVGRDIKINSTPTILVGARVFTGVVPYDKIAAEVDNQLASAQSPSKSK